ncbi:uncharacterized protein LOC120262766 [Dioscorea cayenensis subsp. rotundata]|uniref:Uncharacterized protein LOC120262766 n=1 Tax=Dioscorea cayennensis subsp. rotundata TaxID=55577 RepID=A0AB40BH80_DIOCR|nr:uncharacterized protein LOC120262766 [Dioscorea cayenensis subsp. rotundata]
MKLEDISLSIWRDIGGPRLDQFAFVVAKGSAGGIAIGWNSYLFTGTTAFVGLFCLSVDFISKRDNFSWRCTVVYEPNDRGHKHAFWAELISNKGVKLDHFLVNKGWLDRFPSVVQVSLPRLGSDHVPIRLEVGSHFSKPRPFRYELVWSTGEGFHKLVQHWWTAISPIGCGAFIFSKKLARVRAHLRHWAKFRFGSIKLKKLALLHEIEVLDIAKDSRMLTDIETREEEVLIGKLLDVQKQEEIYWKQRSRLQWLKEEDENMKFFHAVANGRKNRNFIPCVIHGGSTLVDEHDIGRLFTNHFTQQFGFRRPSKFKINFQKLFHLKTPVDLSTLDRPFTLEEVRKAVFELGRDKAPGPDGFPLIFFRQF